MRSGTTTREKAVKKRKHANTCAEADVYADVFRLKNTDHVVIFIYLYRNFSRWTLIEVVNTSFPLLLVTPPCIIYVTQGRGVWSGSSIVPISGVCNYVTRPGQGHHVGGQYTRIFSRKIYMKIEFSSQRREMILFFLKSSSLY